MMRNLRTLVNRIDHDRVRHCLPWMLIVAGPLILFGPMLFLGRALFWGTPILQFVPWRRFAFEALSQGVFPLWNPDLGMGAPLFANYQIALLYPPNCLLYLIGPAWGHGLLVALHLVWAGIGMAILARRLGLRPFSQAIAGMAFGMSGYLVARGGFLSINATAAWLPWIIVVTDRLIQTVGENQDRRRRMRAICLLSVLLTFQWLAGHAQTAWYTLIMIGAWVLWRLIGGGELKRISRVVSSMLLAAVFALLLSAVQLVPTFEYLLQSSRAETLDIEFALNYSFWPWRLLGLFLPGLFGSPATGDYWGYGNYWEDALYIGLLPFILSVYALVRGLRKKGENRRLSVFLTILSACALVLALGKNTPVYPLLFEHVPTFDLFQAPSRWNLLLVFSLALLAGLGADQLNRPSGRALYWVRLGTAGAAIIGAAALFASQLLGEIEGSFVRTFILAGIWFVASGVIVLTKPLRPSMTWNLVAGFIVLADLLVANWGLNPSVPISVFEDESGMASSVDGEHRVYMDAETEYEIKFEWTHRFDTFLNTEDWDLVRDYGLPNTTLLDGIPSANNFDPILPERYVQWMNDIEELPLDQQITLFSLMDVSWQAVIDPTEEMRLEYVYHPDAHRVRWVPQAVRAGTAEEALALVMDPDFDPDTTVVLEGDFETGAAESASHRRVDLVTSKDSNTVIIEASSATGGWLLLSDTWQPGWVATVDDAATEVYRANYLFKAIWVPAGEHHIRFEYRPTSFSISVYVSLVAWFVLVVQGWRWARD